MPFSKVFSIFFLGMVWWGCSQQQPASQVPPESVAPWVAAPVSEESLVLRPVAGRFFYRGQPFSGVSESMYPDGQQRARIEWKDGKKHGEVLRWFDNGQMSYRCRYVAGRREGKGETWWRNGNLRSESHYHQDTPHGVQQQWYKEGALFKRFQLKMGQEEGLQQAWRRNGKLYINYEARHGRIFGLRRAGLCYQLKDETI